MIFRWFCGMVTATAVMAVTAPVRADDGGCWQMIGAAFSRSANAPHAKFISYNQRSAITADRRTLQDVKSNITYRDDGLAYIVDDRFARPFTSVALEPGPPVLGPYGDARAALLSLSDAAKTPLPVIAHVYAYPNESCRDTGVAAIDRLTFQHLVLGDGQRKGAGLRELWIDPLAMDIARVVIRAPIRFFSGFSAGNIDQVLTDYIVDIERVNGYSVVRRVTWQYRDAEHGEYTAEYDFGNYRFSYVPPPGTFPG